MVESWIPWLIGIGLAVIVLLTAWFAYGVWLALHRTAEKARTRWRIYVRTARRLEQIRVKRMQRRGAAPPVRLEIHKVSHVQRKRHERRMR